MKEQAEKKRAAIYARVSTRDQDAQTQVPLLLEWCEKNGYSVSEAHQYVEVASGKDPSRPLQGQLMRAARGHHVHAVICWRLDRWGRSTLDALAKVQQLQDLGVEFHAIKENLHLKKWDTDDRFRLELMQSLASRERNLISDRTKEALDRMKAQGYPNGAPGRPRAPCGDCGCPRTEKRPMTAKRSGRRVPVCADCKARGSEKGMSGASLVEAPKAAGSDNDRFQSPGPG